MSKIIPEHTIYTIHFQCELQATFFTSDVFQGIRRQFTQVGKLQPGELSWAGRGWGYFHIKIFINLMGLQLFVVTTRGVCLKMTIMSELF